MDVLDRIQILNTASSFIRGALIPSLEEYYNQKSNIMPFKTDIFGNRTEKLDPQDEPEQNQIDLLSLNIFLRVSILSKMVLCLKTNRPD